MRPPVRRDQQHGTASRQRPRLASDASSDGGHGDEGGSDADGEGHSVTACRHSAPKDTAATSNSRRSRPVRCWRSMPRALRRVIPPPWRESSPRGESR
uniref:Uncharacterized protein n=1 Tax=uncultured marine virus TaxID=186617 RepID=A0A0F7L5Q0_9VIRU|nr:hypothetical protein [uncultured marine virus]